VVTRTYVTNCSAKARTVQKYSRNVSSRALRLAVSTACQALMFPPLLRKSDQTSDVPFI
jgi:hypothetical protein